jgi:hypothetical protein
MDRETLTIVGVAIVVLTLIGGWYLKPNGNLPAAPPSRFDAAYADDDIRSKFKQQEEAWAKKHKGKPMPAPVEDTPAPSDDSSEAPPNDESVGDSADDGANAEEPEIE